MANHSAHEPEVQQQNEDLWSGGKQPMKVSYGKLMMWYFLLSDAFTFAGFLIAYGALRFSSPTWPVPKPGGSPSITGRPIPTPRWLLPGWMS